MRELIFVPTVLLLCGAAVLWPDVGMCGYLWYALMRPDILAFVDNKYPVSLILAIVAGGSALLHGVTDIPRCLIGNPLVRILVLLQVPVALSVVFSVNTDLCLPRYNYYIRMIAVLLLLPLAIRTESQMRVAFLTFAMSLGVLGVKFGLYGILAGGADLSTRGYGDMLGDNNFVALGLATNLAMCWFGRALVSSKMVKLLLLGMFGCSIAGIVMTNSRGGVISMGICLLLLVARSKYKAVAFLMVLGMMAGSIYLVQDMFVKRMSTLAQYDQEASAESRIQHAKIAVKMWADHPVFGVGFGGINYGLLARFYSPEGAPEGLSNHVAHNSYLQMLVDSGPAAFFLYLGEIVYALWWLRRLNKRLRKQNASPGTLAIGAGIQTSLITFCTGSLFYSADRVDILYILLMMTAAWYAIVKVEHPEGAIQPAALPPQIPAKWVPVAVRARPSLPGF